MISWNQQPPQPLERQCCLQAIVKICLCSVIINALSTERRYTREHLYSSKPIALSVLVNFVSEEIRHAFNREL